MHDAQKTHILSFLCSTIHQKNKTTIYKAYIVFNMAEAIISELYGYVIIVYWCLINNILLLKIRPGYLTKDVITSGYDQDA